MIRWRRRPRTPDPVQPDTSDELAEARRARETSAQALAEECDRWPEIRRLGEAHRQHRDANHFREMFERAIGGRGDPARG